MAGMFSRIRDIFRSKANKALDKMEDPRDTLDLSYEKQLEQLQKVPAMDTEHKAQKGTGDTGLAWKGPPLRSARA